MNMRKILVFAVLFVFISCSNSELKRENDKLITQVSNLSAEVVALKAELTKYEMNPETLLSKAKDAEKSKDLIVIQEVLSDLTQYHPNSPERTSVSLMVSKIQEREKKEKAEVEKNRMQAVSKLKKSYDDVSGNTWYKNPYFTHYTNTNLMSLYIGQKGSSIWLRLMMSYKGEDWIFFDNAYISYQGNTREIIFDKYDNKKTEVGNGGVWEWIDVSVKESDIQFIRNMSQIPDSKMRLSGKYSKTRNLSANERRAIADVMLAYDVLKKGS